MRPVLTILAAIGLAAVAAYSFMHQHWLTGTAFLAGSLALVLPALFGQGLGDLGDAELLIRFVRNPVDTVIDEAVDRVTQSDDEPRTQAAAAPQAEWFDADAAFARYMARRETAGGASPAAGDPAPAPAVRVFGRKQV